MEMPDDIDDVPIDNAPVRRHHQDGLTVEGYSRAAMQTYWRVPELKIGFDFGLQPWAFMTTPTWAVSHTHLDHVAALPAFVGRRRMMKMPEPTIYLPEENVEDVRGLLRAFQRLDRGRLPCNLVGCRPGDEVELSREHVMTCWPTQHSVPSLGYLVWERRKKLKEEYLGLPGERIRDLRLAGVEITHELRIPLLAYLGDSAIEGLDACPDAYRAKVLILEVTYLATAHRREALQRFGHVHIDDLAARADRFRNDVVIGGHFSARYNDEQILRMVENKLPAALRERFIAWL